MADFGIEEYNLAVLLNPKIVDVELRTGETLEQIYYEISVHGRDQRYLSPRNQYGLPF